MKSIYRQPLTPNGIKKLEEGTMEYFDDEIWSNLNTGALEQYLNEKTRVEGFQRSRWRWKNIAFGIFMGVIFALINQYVGLKVGIIVAGNWYIVNLIGMALKWHPTECNLASGASTGASSTCTGFVFTFPAIYLLMKHPDYELSGGVYLISEAMVPPIVVAMICAMLGGLLGVLYFTIFRRIWLIEDPLPVPGFQAYVKLMDIANDRARGAIEQAKKSLKTVATFTGITMIFTFLRDFPISNNQSAFDNMFGGDFYHEGMIMHPYATYTFFGWSMIPIEIAIGWFMRLRTAFLVASGSIFTWFVIVPMAVGFNVPIWIPKAEAYYAVQSFPIPALEIYDPPAFVAAGRVARPIAIGAILGGGVTALLKMAPVFKTAMADVMAIGKGTEGRTDYVKGKGWFEWPMTQIPIMWIVVIIGVVIMFSLVGGFPFLESLIIGILLIVVTFILGAIGVKVMGEIGTTPVSGTSFIVLTILIIVFRYIMGTPTSTALIMALIGTTVFGTALSLSADIIFDFKIGVYTGTRPYHLSKAELTAIPFGAIVAAVGAVILSIGLATINPDTNEPVLNLEAPQAHAFATFTQVIIGNAPWDWILIGIGIGVFAELMTGMGTAFGLGMYLPFTITVNLLIGGGLREWWQKKKLEPQAKAENWTEKQKTLKLLRTYMMATGLIVGEAIMGTIIAIYLVIPLFTGG